MHSRILASVVLLLSSLCVFAQENPTPAPPPEPTQTAAHRPTIGLVLEGGGALGLAHVGVLRWFE